MENHFIMFPIMIVIGLIYGIWYFVKLSWILIGFIIMLIAKPFKKIINKNQRGVNNNVIR